MSGLTVQIVLTTTVWRVLYAGKDQVAGVSGAVAASYAILAACLQPVVMPWQFSSLPLRIMRGQIGVDMIRPRSLVSQCLAQASGTMVGRLPIGFVGLLVGLAVHGLEPPASLDRIPLWLISMCLGVANVLIINLLVSMAAFWTLEIAGPLIVYRFGSAFLSGAVIPPWFMPGWLESIVAWLPFQAQVYAPLSLWFGTVQGTQVLATLGTQAMWIGVLGMLLYLVWRRALRKVVVLGG
ncbi:ABC transporter permease [Amycolatopsis sp. NPDC049868]|uniref:ABC transporter permease n=1 Tax=Amycolatopsis sp. NPDC049868 TaxID=3363934 RepID=UPI0037A0F28A